MRVGHAAHSPLESAALVWVSLDPDWPTGGNARHHGAAGNGAATTAIDSPLNFDQPCHLWLDQFGDVDQVVSQHMQPEYRSHL